MSNTEKYLDLEQGSDEWHAARKQHVTATDAAAILGISPWKTAMDVYMEKLGQGKPFITNPAVELGKAMEEPIREHFEGKVGEWFPPAVVVNPDGWALASLDGINGSKTQTLEIKTCGKKVFEEAMKGRIPSYYQSQIQFQMMCVPSAESCAMTFWNCDRYAYVTIDRDEKYIAMLEAECKSFYDTAIVGQIPPPPDESDSIDLSDNAESSMIAFEIESFYPEYIRLKKEFENGKKKLDALKAQFVDTSDDGSCHCRGVYITKSWRKGSLDTEKMISDGINVEKYRYSPIPSTRMTVK